jgi:hypothetical protein
MCHFCGNCVFFFFFFFFFFLLLLLLLLLLVYPLIEFYFATGSLECLQLKTFHLKLGNVHIVSSFFIKLLCPFLGYKSRP